MAGGTTQTTVEIIFDGLNRVSEVADDIGDSFKGIGDAAEPLANTATAILGIQAALIGLAAAGAETALEFKNATNDISRQLGVPAEKAQELQISVIDLYGDSFVESIESGTELITQAFRQFGDVGEEELLRISQNAAGLQKAFDIDFEQSLGAANTLVREFGISSEEAFNLLTLGLQEVPADDLLETITEYSAKFKEGGVSADQFFNLVKSGTAQGILGTDAAADAFAEFLDKIQDGGKAQQEALASLGLSFDDIQKQINTGQITIADAFTLVTDKLAKTTDQTVQFSAGVALIGEPFIKLGQTAGSALTLTGNALEDSADRAKKLRESFDDFGTSFAGLFRKIRIEIAGLPIWDDFFEEGKETIDKVAKLIPEAFDQVDFSGLLDGFKALESEAGDVFQNLFSGIDLNTPEGIAEVIQRIVGAVETFIDLTQGIVESWQPAVKIFGEVLKVFSELDDESAQLIGNILGVAQQVVILTTAVAAGAAVFGGIKTAVVAGGAALKGVGVIVGGIASTFAGAIVGAAAIGAAIGTLIRQFDGVDDAAQGIIESLDAVFGVTDTKTTEELQEIDDAFFEAKEKAKKLREEREKLNDIPAPEPIEIEVDSEPVETAGLTLEEFNKELEKARETGTTREINTEVTGTEEAAVKFSELTGEEQKLIDVKVDDDIAKGKLEVLGTFTRDGKVFEVTAEANTTEATKELEKIPDEKKIDLAVKIEREKIEQELKIIEINAESLREKFKYAAEVETAQAEEAAARVASAFESVNAGIESTGSSIIALFGLLEGASLGVAADIEEQIDRENDLRERQFELQKRLTEEQIKFLEARRKRLDGGEALITIDGSKIQPELELVYDAVIRLTQIKSTEEGFDILGLPI